MSVIEKIMQSASPSGSLLPPIEEATQTQSSLKRGDAEVVEKVKAVAERIRKKEITHEQAAEECGIHVMTLMSKLKALTNNKDLTRRKPHQKITEAIAEKIKALAPKIKSKEVTLEKAAEECGISMSALRVKLKALKGDIDLSSGLLSQNTTEELVVPMTPVKMKDAGLLLSLVNA